jgi:hypothetical protein
MAVTEIASLAEVKNYLRVPNPGAPSLDDATVQAMMAGAQDAIEKELGPVVSRPVAGERHDGGRAEVWLRVRPVLYVQNVEEGWGYYDWELDDQQVNSIPALSIWAYSLDNPKEGLVTRRSAGNVQIPFVRGRNNIRVDYVAGRLAVPGNAKLAFLELVAHWYRSSQLRTASQVSPAFNPSALNADFTKKDGETSVNLGVPSEILEMLKAGRARPIVA